MRNNINININIMIAEENDLNRIIEIQKQAFTIQAKIYNDHTIPPLHEKIKDLKKDLDRNTILKAMYGHIIIGSIRGAKNKNSCHIYRLSVDPEYHNRGIGTLLIKAIEAQFPTVTRFDLFTGYKSKKNLYMYKKMNYKIFKEIINYKSKRQIKIIYMEKILHSKSNIL